MIPALRNDDIIEKFGGRFKLCVLIQRRWLQLMQGARPMVDATGLSKGYCSFIKRGIKIPHERHWPSLERLIRVGS